MAHTSINYKTKAELEKAVKEGQQVTLSQDGFFPPPTEGKTTVEGPHEFHRWYAAVTLKNGIIVKVT